MKRLILSIVALAVSASPLAAKVGFLEPKPSNKNGIYYHSDIISLEEGEKFEVLLAEGRSSQDFALYIYKHDSDPSSEPISDTAESYLSHRTTESLKGETLYGPLKIFNVSTVDPDPLNTRRLYRPIVQYRISAVEDLSLAALASGVENNTKGIETNAKTIQDNATGIAANATAIGANATTLGIHERRITESLLGSEQSRSNEERLETAELRITESLLGSEQSRSNEERLKVIAADIATNSTTIQDNATGITANGTAIAGNGTSIQDNATGIATNGTAIAGNTAGIQDNTTGLAANVMAIAGNLSKIQAINQTIEGINRDLDLGKNERGRNVLEIGKNQLRFQALETRLGLLGSDPVFIQELGEEFATKDDLTTAISEGKTQGINAVTSDPNNWNVFTADQIQEMAVDDLVLTREENGDFVLNYEIQQSDNAKDWTTYSAQAETITGLPVNKAFVRIRTR